MSCNARVVIARNRSETIRPKSNSIFRASSGYRAASESNASRVSTCSSLSVRARTVAERGRPSRSPPLVAEHRERLNERYPPRLAVVSDDYNLEFAACDDEERARRIALTHHDIAGAKPLALRDRKNLRPVLRRQIGEEDKIAVRRSPRVTIVVEEVREIHEPPRLCGATRFRSWRHSKPKLLQLCGSICRRAKMPD